MSVSTVAPSQAGFDTAAALDPRPLRIAFVSYEYPPHTEGGAGTYAGELARELVALGHAVTVFAPNRRQAYGNARVVPVGSAGTRAAGFWASLPATFVHVERRAGVFDIIHGNAVADLSLSRHVFRGARVVTLHHLTRSIPLGPSGLRHRLHDLRGETAFGPLFEGIVLRRADRVICVSETVKDDVIRLCGLRPSQIAVIANGSPIIAAPDPALVASLRHTYAPEGGALTLAVGRVEHRKGTSILLEAFAGLPLDGRPAHLVLVGNGSIDQYRAMACRLGIQDRVHFTGYVTDEVRNALYAACDVFVSAALHEGFGLTVFEAMAIGKPVVVTDTGAAAAGWVSREHGAVVALSDVVSLRDAVAELLASPSKREAVGRSNRAYAEKWVTWHSVAVETQRIYREAIADRCAGERQEIAG